MSARQAAGAVLELCSSPTFREMIRYATQDVFVDLSFACLLHLKLSRLFPTSVDLHAVARQAQVLQSVLAEVPESQRFSLTIKYVPVLSLCSPSLTLI